MRSTAAAKSGWIGRCPISSRSNSALPPPTYAREDFVVAGGSRSARLIDRWPDWSAPALALSGPTGCGKTHLARIWAAGAPAPLSSTAAISRARAWPTCRTWPRGHPRIVLEGADRAPERALFHLYNQVARAWRPPAADVHVLPPAHWSIALPDLASLRAAPAVAVAPPDDELLGSIISGSSSATGNCMPAPGSCSIWCRIYGAVGRSCAAGLQALDRRGLIEQREIDRRLAADVLAELSGVSPTT